ncbi:Fructosamine/Ketosamine-3-kinase [Cokeromyces recurvatus]|uniref:Fructosamine/Ketosamine-3-kinase n=1 Tax=Cokeromyces recurvatus TaxID=90255 RepID=UPI00221F225D|nr:Fructosamine/Ketosamine-3-kinase [Cokeromyces recurvatus]KAI7903632.1 Fructosamine/Ketosamine-3-kinase [Cokeromyces recurvatus]
MSRSDFISFELQRLNLCKKVNKVKTLSGGCISQAACYSTDKGDYFIKSNSNHNASAWFTAEFLALNRINEAVPGFAPKPIHHSTQGQEMSYIVTDYIPMGNSSKSDAQKELGRLLSTLHASSIIEQNHFGFDIPSWCGTTELDNTWSSNWAHFWKCQRLEPLLKQVKGQNEDVDRLGNLLCSHIEHWLGEDAIGHVKPSLLHGDLWYNNWAVYATGSHQPIIFDPASYYGHYEAEFGIMNMFGGFTQDCFDSYYETLSNQAASSLEITTSECKEDRIMIYESYHHLNHYAMFGGGYGSSFVNLLENIL